MISIIKNFILLLTISTNIINTGDNNKYIKANKINIINFFNNKLNTQGVLDQRINKDIINKISSFKNNPNLPKFKFKQGNENV